MAKDFTRTIVTTEVEVTLCKKEDATVSKIGVIIADDVSGWPVKKFDAAVLNAIPAVFDNCVMVKADIKKVTSEVRGISMQEFLEHSHPVQRGKKEEQPNE